MSDPARVQATGQAYLRSLALVVQGLADTHTKQIPDIGARVGASLGAGGVLHLFGAGHSRLAAEDVCIRAGSLTATRAIWPDRMSDKFERYEGLAPVVLSLGDVQPGEILMVISNSGINPMPIDVATEARDRGAYVVGVGSREHSLAVPSRHSSGQRLLDVCDTYLDTRVPAGDALIQDERLQAPVGPASTIAAAALLHAVLVEATGWLVGNGHIPPLRISRNMPGGDEHNAELSRQYAQRIPELKWV